jgi:HD superfamily phosphohydrolase YqeK
MNLKIKVYHNIMTELYEGIEIIREDAGLQRIDLALKDYWRQNPPYLSHAYHHAVKTGRICYGLASGYSENAMFAAGLLHDVYRPVGRRSGQEEHGKRAAELAREICSSAGFHLGEEEIAAIDNCDSTEKISSWSDKILFAADKADFTVERCFAYVSETNKARIGAGGQPRYTSMFDVLSDGRRKIIPNAQKLLYIARDDFDFANNAYLVLRTTEDLIWGFAYEEMLKKTPFDSIVQRYVDKYMEKTLKLLVHSGVPESEARKMFLM